MSDHPDARAQARMIIASDAQSISDESAAAILALLTANEDGPEDPPTFTFMYEILMPPGPEEDPAWRESRLSRAVANGLALGLHREPGGATIRLLLLPNPEADPSWDARCAALMDRALAEIAA